MSDVSRPLSLSVLFSAVQEPRIVLAALVRLRWLAVVGQVTATAVATAVLGLRLPIVPIAVVVGLTAFSNLTLSSGMRLGRPPVWLIPIVLLLDVVLLTSLLYLTGGPQNPFSALYLVHVAMAVIVLGSAWTWLVVATVAVCYGAILRWHLPLFEGESVPAWAVATGSWLALMLVSVLVTVFIGRVIRALRQREGELAGARERAARNEQLAALTTLAAGAAHELNTPLGTIAVVAKELELSCNPAGGTEAVLEDARLIRREVDRCRTILSRMRFKDYDAAPEGAAGRLDELAARLRDQLGVQEQGRLQVRCAPGVEAAPSPAPAIEQALLVLLRNAFDASPDDKPVSLEIDRQGEQVRFEISDSGCGMSEDLLRHAGQPFFTTKGPGKGMGLGLFLVNLVAEQCGATFSLESQVGQGTRCVLLMAEGGAGND